MDAENKKPLPIILGGVALLIVLGVFVYTRWAAKQPEKVHTAQGFYYTGPRRNAKDPNVWVDADGNRVPPPPDATPVKSSPSTLGPKTGGTTTKP